MDKSGKFVVRAFPGIPTDDICDQERSVDCRHYAAKRGSFQSQTLVSSMGY